MSISFFLSSAYKTFHLYLGKNSILYVQSHFVWDWFLSGILFLMWLYWCIDTPLYITTGSFRFNPLLHYRLNLWVYYCC